MADNNNNLEKYFRQKFNQKIEPQDWNTPDDDLWDKISDKIPPKNGKRRSAILPLFFLSGLMALLLILAYDNYRKTNQISELQKELKECAQQSPVSQDVKPEKLNWEEKAERNNIPTLSPNKLYASGQNRTKAKNKTNLGTTQYPLSGVDTKTFPISDNNLNLDSNSKQVSRSDQNIGLDSLLITEYLPLRKMEISAALMKETPQIQMLDNRPHPIIKTSSFETIKPKQPTSDLLWISPVMGYIWWQDKVKGNYNNPLTELLVKEETTPSLVLGISLNKSLNKQLVLKTGLHYYQRSQISEYALNLPYSKMDEIAIGTEYENKFQHSLPTGLGNISTRLVLSRNSNSTVTESENVSLDFSLKNQFTSLSFPLMISYYLKESGRGLYIQGGFMNEWIIRNSIKEVNTLSHHTLIKDKSIAVDYDISQIKKFNVSALIEIGYQKRIFNGLDVGISANYGFALTNTFANQNYTHKINQSGVYVTAMKSLN